MAENGERGFEPRAVHRIAQARGRASTLEAGEVSARAWEMFAAGEDLVAVMREVRRPVEELRTLRAQYLEECERALLLSGSERAALEGIAGRELRNGADVLAFVSRLVRAVRSSRNGSSHRAPD